MKIGIRNSNSAWTPLTRRPTPEKLTLLRVMGSLWSFQDPGDGRLYRFARLIQTAMNDGLFRLSVRSVNGSPNPRRRDFLASAVKRLAMQSHASVSPVRIVTGELSFTDLMCLL